MNRKPLRSLRARLVLAFIGVGIAAVALLAALTVRATRSELGALGREQARSATTSVGASAAQAYQQAGGWPHADLRPTLALATEAGAQVTVFDDARRSVAAAVPAGQDQTGNTPPLSAPVLVAGRQVGMVILHFPDQGLSRGELGLQSALVRAVAIGAALAALLAVAVALVVARRITRPLSRIIEVLRARETGARDDRVGDLRAPSELAELAIAFDRMADAAGRQEKLRSALVADVAHELRTPLGVLQASTEAMLDGLIPPSMHAISSLHDEVLRMGRRVEDLQVLASAEAAGLQMNTEPVDFTAVVRQAAAAFEPQFAAADVLLATELVQVTVTGDAGRLNQIVTNLMSNALKFSPTHGRVRIALTPETHGARLTVSDSGQGIEPAELGRIFDRFFRGSAATGTPGSGIGLAVVAELVATHHGHISVHSEPGAGTTFEVSLPGP